MQKQLSVHTPYRAQSKYIKPDTPAREIDEVDEIEESEDYKDKKPQVQSHQFFENDDKKLTPEEEIEQLLQEVESINTNVHDFYFKVDVFFKYFILHIVYLCLLGPGIIIFQPFVGPHLLYNLQFIGKNMAFQTSNYIMIVVFLFLFYYLDVPDIHFMEIYMVIIAVIIRVVTISVKYAYTSEAALKLMSLKRLGASDLKRDFMLDRWRTQTEDMIEQEVQAALLRLDVDSSLFFFEFIGQQSYPELVKKFTKSEIINKKAKSIKKHRTRKVDDVEKKLKCMNWQKEKNHNQWFDLISKIQDAQSPNTKTNLDEKKNQAAQAIKNLFSTGKKFPKAPLTKVSAKWKRSIAAVIQQNKKKRQVAKDNESMEAQQLVRRLTDGYQVIEKSTPEVDLENNKYVDFTPEQSIENFNTPSPQNGQKKNKSEGKVTFGQSKSSPNLGEEEITKTETDDKDPENAFLYRHVFSKFSVFFQRKPLQQCRLFGYNLLLDMIKQASQTRNQNIIKIVMIVSLIRAFIPFFYRLYKGHPFLSSSPGVALAPLLINFLFFAVNAVILAMLMLDLYQRIYCLKQIGFMISPKKIVSFKEKKLYPTLNIFDPISLKTWANLRRAIFDYGSRYIARNSVNITVIMIFYFFILVILVLQTLGVIKAYSDPLLLIIFTYETIFYLGLFTKMLFGAAFINDQYRVHKNLLIQNKMIISDFSQLTHLYVGPNAIQPDNPIYREGIRLLKEDLGEEQFGAKLKERSETLIATIDGIIEALSFEEINCPMKILGLPITFNIIGSLGVGLLSVIFAVVQSFFG